MHRSLSTIYLACAIAAGATGAAWAQEDAQNGTVKVSVARLEENAQKFYEVRAEAFIAAQPQTVWKVLTDYDRFHQYVPGLLSSKVIARNDKEITVEQEGRVGVFFFARKIHLVIRVVEQPYSRIDIDLVSGDMKRYESHWELIQETQDGVAGTRINYQGKLEPVFFMPAIFAGAMIKSDGRKMLEAVVAEIKKSPAP